MVMCQCRFIIYYKCTTQGAGRAANHGGLYMYGGREIWKISVPSLNFEANLELLLKIKLIKNLKNKKSCFSGWVLGPIAFCCWHSQPMSIAPKGQEVGPRSLLGEG